MSSGPAMLRGGGGKVRRFNVCARLCLVDWFLIHCRSRDPCSRSRDSRSLCLVHGFLVHCCSRDPCSRSRNSRSLCLVHWFIVHCRSRDPCARSQGCFCRSRFPCSRSLLSRSPSFTRDPRSRILVHSRSRRSLSFTIVVHCRSLVHSRSRILVHSRGPLGGDPWAFGA